LDGTHRVVDRWFFENPDQRDEEDIYGNFGVLTTWSWKAKKKEEKTSLFFVTLRQ
jgi:hypothetical protein